MESRYLDVKSGAGLTNGKQDWLIQLLLREKRRDDAKVLSSSVGGGGQDVPGRQRDVTPYTLLSQYQKCTRRLVSRACASDSGRKPTVLLLDTLADPSNPWIQGNPGGDIVHLPYALAKYVQDIMWRTVSWVSAPSDDRSDMLDMKQLRDLLMLVIAWDPKHPRNGELAIYNSLRISLPGHVDKAVCVRNVA